MLYHVEEILIYSDFFFEKKLRFMLHLMIMRAMDQELEIQNQAKQKVIKILKQFMIG